MESTMTNLYKIHLRLSLLMKTLNKDRINILKLNVRDFLYRFNPSLDTKSSQIISWQITTMRWLKTDKQDVHFTTILILFREEYKKWSNDLNALAFFVK